MGELALRRIGGKSVPKLFTDSIAVGPEDPKMITTTSASSIGSNSTSTLLNSDPSAGYEYFAVYLKLFNNAIPVVMVKDVPVSFTQASAGDVVATLSVDTNAHLVITASCTSGTNYGMLNSGTQFVYACSN